MVNGRLYDARTMDEVGNHPQKRGKFWWEGEGAPARASETPPHKRP